MDFREYVELAIRTESLYPVINPSHEQTNINDSLFHSAIGIQTEVWEIFEALFIKDWELDTVNLREEVGDIMWYIAIACKKLDYYDIDFWASFDTEKYENYTEYAYRLNYQSIELLDSFKKSLFYNKPLDIAVMKERLLEIYKLWGAFVELLGGDIVKICEINIKKLQARYPEKFTTEKAVNRDLQTERKILES